MYSSSAVVNVGLTFFAPFRLESICGALIFFILLIKLLHGNLDKEADSPFKIAGNGDGKSPPSSRSLVETISSIQRSKIGLEDWSLTDLTIGLYLIYLRQASLNPFEDVKGVQVLSESTVSNTSLL